MHVRLSMVYRFDRITCLTKGEKGQDVEKKKNLPCSREAQQGNKQTRTEHE